MSQVGQEARRLAATLLPEHRGDPEPSAEAVEAIRLAINALEPEDEFDSTALAEASETVQIVLDHARAT